MKNRKQQTDGGVSQQEVLATSCPKQPTLSIQQMVQNRWNMMNVDEKLSMSVLSSTKTHLLMRDEINLNKEIKNNNKQETANENVSSYAACTESNDWYVSQKVITCSYEERVYGFAPDPKDCSTFYVCDQSSVAYDGTSKGYLMSCVAGLWWDQGRRMCSSPMEVSCNPYNIINTQAGTSMFYLFKSLFVCSKNYFYFKFSSSW
jgi:hypothetical protein